MTLSDEKRKIKMAEITSADIKELRERTGSGILDCKKALVAAEGNMQEALEWLQKKGLANAEKKASRIAAEGLVGLKIKDNNAVMIEINSETDFVARNDEFQKFVSTMLDIALKNKGDVQDLLNASYDENNVTVKEALTNLIAKIGENITLRRLTRHSTQEGAINGYIHNGVADNLGKLGALVTLDSKGNKDELSSLAKNMAMHVAAMNPSVLVREDLSNELIDKQKEILRTQVEHIDKPVNVIDKILEGRLEKFFQTVVLSEQAYIMSSDMSIAAFLKEKEKEMGQSIKLSHYSYFKVGEGIEKEEKDFSKEVAAQLNK